MSLEQALIDATAAITRLTTVLVTASESGNLSAPAPAPAAATTEKKGRGKAAAAAAEPVAAADSIVLAPAPGSVNDGSKKSIHLCAGDPEGTLYFVIEAHNTVAAIKPGETVPNIAGMVQVGGDAYTAKKAEFAKKFALAQAAASTPAPAQAAPVATPAPAAPAPTATAQPATASDGPTFADVVTKMRELHAAQSNAGVKKILDQYGVASVPLLNGKASNAELIGAIDSALMGL